MGRERGAPVKPDVVTLRVVRARVAAPTMTRATTLLLLSLAACNAAATATTDSSVASDLATSDAPDTTATTDASDDTAPADVLDVVETREAGGACSYNRDCVSSERCACSTSAGCRCAPGTRGTGRAGLDRCTSGDDCESALCVEANGGISLCSAPCAAASECPAALPRCLSVPTVGRFCARDPSATVDAGAPITLTARFGARTGPFDRAQHGVEGTDRVYLEAHFGGDPACPSMTSPTPQRTFVLSGVRASVTTVQTEADGVTASLLDFSGDLVSVPLARASSVRVTPRSIVRGTSVSLDVTATFAGGTIEGSLVAPHCASLDGR
jgi:hypothetical protein